ncbi:hypothetical protein NS376_12220 [Pseudomonas oryzihabitans]|nr:hypothetical protein NS376_12220 [Pseudomonas psychrotolerans]KTT56021.1 hypothetical protein SB8_15755 [Pseudomonas psychrotolerans]
MSEDRYQGERIARCYLPADELDYGESAEQRVNGFFRETLAVELAAVKPLGTLENLEYDDRRIEFYHELILLYEARFADVSLYERSTLQGRTERGESLELCWRGLEELDGQRRRLVPAVLQERLNLLLA